MNFLFSSSAYSQRLLTSFGRQTELPLDYVPASVALGPLDATQSRRIILGERQKRILHFYRVTPKGALEEQSSREIPAPVRSLRCLTPGVSATGEYLGLSTDGNSLLMLKETRNELQKRVTPVPAASERFFVTNLNNDTWPDVLLFGRNSAGLQSLLGGPGGKFREGPLLFPEISASDVQSWDLNGDGITDLVLANWLTRQVNIFFGMGRGVFSEQISFDLPGEPLDLALTGQKKTRTFCVAVTIPEQGTILTLAGNALGELRLSGRVDAQGGPTGVAYTSVNGDEFPDIVSSTGQGMLVALGVSMTEVGAPTFFGAGANTEGWTIGDVDGDRENDLVLIDRAASKLVVLANAADIGSSSWPNIYGAGSGPRSIAAADLNADGQTDIAVANELSSTVSVFLNKGGGVLEGQQAIRLADPPAALKIVFPPSTGGPLLITSHAETNTLALIRPDRRISESISTTVTVCENPLVLGAGVSRHSTSRVIDHPGLQLFVRCLDTRSGSQTLSVLDQMNKTNFLERSIQPSVPYKITALTVSQLRTQGQYDLLFAAHDATSRTSSVYVAYSLDSLTFATPKRLTSFRDTARCVQGILAGDVDGDGLQDVLVPLRSPVNALAIAYGIKNGQVRDSLHWVRGVHMTAPESSILEDVNGDGPADLTYIDDAKGSVVTLYGRVKGRFSPPVTIWQGRSVRTICVASLRQPDVRDLIMADAVGGTVSVVFNPFRK